MIHSNPLVSIVTPSFNQAQYLEQTIQSVLSQDYPAIEYLVVDGGSTDGSVEIIRKYADRLTWWVSEPDTGQAEAINKGLVRANGEFIAWLNSDDIYLPGAVSQAAEALNQDPRLGLVFGNALSIDEKGKPIGIFSFPDWNLLDLASFRIICQPAVFMRRSILKQSGELIPDYHFMLDHQLWIRIARISTIQHIDMPPLGSNQPVAGLLAAARQHPQAKNVSQAAGFGYETMQMLTWMETQPDLAELIAANRRRIEAGAYRLNARYLLENDMPSEALASYWRSLINDPSYAIKHAHRMLYSVLALANLDRMIKPLMNRNIRRRRKKLAARLRQTKVINGSNKSNQSPRVFRLQDWPFLDLRDE